MKKVIQKRVELCDVCLGEIKQYNMLSKCIVCGRDFCFSCQGSSLYNVFNINLCKDCRDISEVKKLIEEKYLEIWREFKAKLTEELKDTRRD